MASNPRNCVDTDCLNMIDWYTKRVLCQINRILNYLDNHNQTTKGLMEKPVIPGRLGHKRGGKELSDQSPVSKIKKYHIARIRVSSLRPGFDYSLSEKIQGWGFQGLKIDDDKKWFSAEVPRDGSVTFILDHEKENTSSAGMFRLNKINNLNGGGATLIDFGSLYIAGSVNAKGIKNAMEFCGNGNEHLSWEITGSSEPVPITASVNTPAQPVGSMFVRHQGPPPVSPKADLPRFVPPTVNQAPPAKAPEPAKAIAPPVPLPAPVAAPPKPIAPPATLVVVREITPAPLTEAVLKAAREEAPVIPKTEGKLTVEPVNDADQPQETNTDKLKQTKPKTEGNKMKQKQSNPALLAHVRNACLKYFKISPTEFKGEPVGVKARQVFCALVVTELKQGGGADTRAEIGAPETSPAAAHNNATSGNKHLAADKELRQWADDLVEEVKEKFKDAPDDSIESSPVKPQPPVRRQKSARIQKPGRATAKPRTKPPTDGVENSMQRIQDIVIYAFQRSTKCSVGDLAKALGAGQEAVAACLGRALVEQDTTNGEMTELISTIVALGKLTPSE